MSHCIRTLEMAYTENKQYRQKTSTDPGTLASSDTVCYRLKFLCIIIYYCYLYFV